jgi:peptidoglycan hydrolase-like protein with peptidoglycan-binding domain
MHRILLIPLLLLLGTPARAQDKPTSENIMAIQDALIWTGDYSGPLDGSLGGATLNALKAFQTRENSPAKGRVIATDVRKLSNLSDAAKRDAGWSLTVDGTNNVVLFLPRALLTAESKASGGRGFASADGKIALSVFTSPDGLTAFHTKAKAGERIVQETLDKQRSVVVGTERDREFFAFATPAKTGAKGFRLTYPSSEAARLRPIANAIANGFNADPAAPAAKKTARSLPNFIGAYRFDERVRPYPYGAIDVEDRTVTIAGPNFVANLSATEPPPADGKPVKKKRRPEADAPFLPQLTIYAEGKPLFEATDPAWLTHFADLRVVELDPANAAPEVVLTSFTDGAHCCTLLTVFSAAADGTWTRIDGGSFDGSPDFPQDLDGDGRFELVNTDNAFLEAFDCYACSYAPDEIRRLDGGRLIDVSADAAFRHKHRERLGEMFTRAWQEGAVASEGFLAGFVAAARRTGDGDDAWAFLEANHSPAKKKPDEPFAAKLKTFLAEEGY